MSSSSADRTDLGRALALSTGARFFVGPDSCVPVWVKKRVSSTSFPTRDHKVLGCFVCLSLSLYLTCPRVQLSHWVPREGGDVHNEKAKLRPKVSLTSRDFYIFVVLYRLCTFIWNTLLPREWALCLSLLGPLGPLGGIWQAWRGLEANDRSHTKTLCVSVCLTRVTTMSTSREIDETIHDEEDLGDPFLGRLLVLPGPHSGDHWPHSHTHAQHLFSYVWSTTSTKIY